MTNTYALPQNCVTGALSRVEFISPRRDEERSMLMNDCSTVAEMRTKAASCYEKWLHLFCSGGDRYRPTGLLLLISSARLWLVFGVFSFCHSSVVGGAQQLAPFVGTLRGLDPPVMNIGADPCDFANYACRHLDKRYPIRVDQMAFRSHTGSGAQIRAVLKEFLVERASQKKHNQERWLLDKYYAVFVDGKTLTTERITALRTLFLAFVLCGYRDEVLLLRPERPTKLGCFENDNQHATTETVQRVNGASRKDLLDLAKPRCRHGQ
jgi:hypothetical protein